MKWSELLQLGAEDPGVETLLDTLACCHRQAARANANASSTVVRAVASCGVSWEQAITAGLMTFGDKHGPVSAARQLLYRTTNTEITWQLEAGAILPGWGNSFYKDRVDPAFAPIHQLIQDEYPSDYEEIERIGSLIFKVRGRTLYPNAATFNAVCASVAGIPQGCEMALVVACRLGVWSRQYAEARS